MKGIIYASVTVASSTLSGVVGGWLLYFYLPPTGTPLVPVALYSLVILVSQAIDIGIALPIGFLSDRTHTRWGRRLPYIVCGAIFLPFLFIFLWIPPHSTTSVWNLVYLGLVLLAFNVAYEVFQTPYNALLPELIPEDRQRINVSAWESGFQLLGAVLVGTAGPLIEKTGFAHSAVIFAVITAPFLFMPLILLRKSIGKIASKATTSVSFKESFRLTLSNRPFQVFASAYGLFWLASTFILGTLPFIVTEICGLTEADTIYFYLSAFALSIACYPIVSVLAKRFGKERVFGSSLLAGAIILPGLFLIGKQIHVPLVVQGLIWISLEAIGLSGVQVLPGAIIAEITDLDEKITGQRREGVIYSAWSLIDKAAAGIGLALLPLFLLMGRSKMDTHGPLGVRLLGVVGGLFMLTGFLVFRHYDPNIRSSS